MKNNIIIVYGPKGSGKTHLVNKITKHEPNKIHVAFYFNVDYTIDIGMEFMSRCLWDELNFNFKNKSVSESVIIECDPNLLNNLLHLFNEVTLPVKKIFIEVQSDTLGIQGCFYSDISIVKTTEFTNL